MAGPKDEQEIIKQNIALLEEYKERVDELEAAELRRAAQARAVLQARLEGYSKDIEHRNKWIATLQQQLDQGEITNAAKRQDAEEHLAMLKKEVEEKRKAHKEAVKNQKQIRKLLKETTAIQQAYARQLEDVVKKAAASGNSIEAVTERIKGQEVGDFGAGGMTEILDQFKNAAQGTLTGTSQAIEAIYSDVGKFAPLMLFGVGASLQEVQRNVKSMPAQIDRSFRSVIKSTGFEAEKLKGTFVAMLDPLHARRTDPLFKNLDKESQALANVGLTAQDVGGAMQQLTDDVALFRPSFIENNKVAATFTGNLIAGLKKLGAPLGASTKTLNLLTKAMKFTPMQAAKSLKSLVSVADSLGVSTKQVFTNFQSVGPSLAMFGDRTVEVFAELQAKAQATGIEMNKLSGYAEKLDTFKGAASAAQQLNAVLGSTVLSVTDLVHADPAEKFTLIQEAVAAAGVDFETADRRMKQVIASAAGMKVDDFAKLVMNKEESEEAAAALDTTAMSQEELKKKLEETMTQAELMQKNLSSLGGGFEKFLGRTRGAASEAGDVMMSAFSGVLEINKNSEAAALGMVVQLEAIAKMRGIFGRMTPFQKGTAAAVAAGGTALHGLISDNNRVDQGTGPVSGPPRTQAPADGTGVTPGQDVPFKPPAGLTIDQVLDLITTTQASPPAQPVEIKLVLSDGKEIASATYADIKKLFGQDTTIALS